MNTGPLSPHRDDPAGTSAVIRRDRGIILIGRARRGLTAAAVGTSLAIAALASHASHSRATLARSASHATTSGSSPLRPAAPPAAAPVAPSAPAVVSGGS